MARQSEGGRAQWPVKRPELGDPGSHVWLGLPPETGQDVRAHEFPLVSTRPIRRVPPRQAEPPGSTASVPRLLRVRRLLPPHMSAYAAPAVRAGGRLQCRRALTCGALGAGIAHGTQDRLTHRCLHGCNTPAIVWNARAGIGNLHFSRGAGASAPRRRRSQPQEGAWRRAPER
jgi:hypothetical protein